MFISGLLQACRTAQRETSGDTNVANVNKSGNLLLYDVSANGALNVKENSKIKSGLISI